MSENNKQAYRPPLASPSCSSIELRANDDCFERARKILKCAGMADWLGMSGRLAEAIEAYRKMDRKAAILEANDKG